jgi:type II secretory pathway pseudopilin PulG
MPGPWTTPSGAGRSDLRCSDSDGGFTLVEILVASVILFTCLGAAAISYNTAVNLAQKLDETIAVSSAMPRIREQIKTQLFQGTLSGTIVHPGDPVILWQAAERQSAFTLSTVDESPDRLFEPGRFRLILYTVTLTGRSGQLDNAYSQVYTYTELVWEERYR